MTDNDRPETDVYPVGLLAAVKHHGLRNGTRRSMRHVRRWARQRNWRAIRNTFNGYLAEHRHGGHNAGRGWTRRAALRRVERICRSEVSR
jgi:hypothetical protein